VTPEAWNGAVLASNLIGIRVSQELRPELLAEFLNSTQGRHAIERRLSGSNLLVLTPQFLADVEVPVPPLEEQSMLVELIRASDEQYQAAVTAAENRRRIAHRIVVSALNGRTTRMEEER
jgi:restriction endonuclease S subunit